MYNDRSSLELQAYLRDEWKTNPSWLALSVRRPEGSLHARLHRWLLARSRKPQGSSPGPAPDLEAPSPARDWLASSEVCPHPLTEDLGFGTNAEFLRCTVCGGVLVVRGARQWQIGGPAAATAGSPEACSDDMLGSCAEGVEIG